MMVKILLPSFLVLLCCVLVDALKCHVCKRYHSTTGCLKGKGVCVAEPGQFCKFVKYYAKETPHTGERGCTAPGDRCNVLEKKGALITATTCCDYEDFCMYKEAEMNTFVT